MRYLFDLKLPVYHWNLLFPLMVSTFMSRISAISLFSLSVLKLHTHLILVFSNSSKEACSLSLFSSYLALQARAVRVFFFFLLHFSVIFFPTSLLSLLRIHLSQTTPSWRVVFWHTFNGVLHFVCPRFTYFPLLSPFLPPLSFSRKHVNMVSPFTSLPLMCDYINPQSRASWLPPTYTYLSLSGSREVPTKRHKKTTKKKARKKSTKKTEKKKNKKKR